MRRFFLIFLAIQLLLLTIVELRVVQQQLFWPWTPLVAKICALLLTPFDDNAAAMGNLLWNPTTGFGVAIEPGCNGIEACVVLLAAIVAFPSSWRMRAWGLAWGFVAVQGLNLVRLISLFYIKQWNQAVFDFAHIYLWQGLIMLDVLVFWLFWVRASTRADGTPKALLPVHP